MNQRLTLSGRAARGLESKDQNFQSKISIKLFDLPYIYYIDCYVNKTREVDRKVFDYIFLV